MNKDNEEARLKEILSVRLRLLLDKRDMTQKDLADILNLDKSAVGKWISGKSIPRMGHIQIIADYFNVPKSYLLNEDTLISEDMLDMSEYLRKRPEARVLLDKAGNLTEEQLNSVIALIEAMQK